MLRTSTKAVLKASENRMPETLIDAPVGPLGVRWEGEILTGIDLDPMVERLGTDPACVPKAIQAQLRAYFESPSACFDLPLRLLGTAFQQRVWAELCRIPPGETRTYGEIAGLLGSGARAVGQACRANPCPIVVPCHRVVAATGLGGFAGDTSGRKLEVKRWLLDHEAVKPRPHSITTREADSLPEDSGRLFLDAV